MDVSTLDTDGFVTVPYPAFLHARVESAMHSWMTFCAMPQSVKNTLSNDDPEHDFGYMRRLKPDRDNKEMFHLTRRTLPQIYERLTDQTVWPILDFIGHIDALTQAVMPIVHRFCQEVEVRFEVPNLTRDVVNSSHHWTFRFLHYFPGAIIAKPHVDRGSITLHLGENDAGVECLGFDGVWHPLSITDDQTIIFPSVKMQHRTQGRLKALCHRVTATERSRILGRYAIVAFVDFPWHCELPQEFKAQSREPGFNYDMPFDQFSKLFVPVTG